MRAIVKRLFADDHNGLLHQVGEVLDGDVQALIDKGLADAIEDGKPVEVEKSVEIEKPKRKKAKDNE